MATNLIAFTAAVAHNLRDLVLAPIADFISSRGHPVTVDELGTIFDLPAGAPVTPAVAPNTTTPVAPRNPRPADVPTIPGGPVVAGGTCPYLFKRGLKKDTVCGKPNVPGFNGCTSHKGGETVSRPRTAAPGIAPGAGSIPGMAGLPPGYAPPVPPPSEGEQGEISVVAFDESRNLFREPNHDFIVFEHGNGVIAVIGRWNKSDNSIVGLSDNERQVAQSLGLIVADNSNPGSYAVPIALPPIAPMGERPSTSTSSASQVPVGVPQVPVPQVPMPSVPSVPQMPQVPIPAVPSVPQVPIPAVPSVPQVPIPAVPSVPQVPQVPIPAVPSVPQVPQVPTYGSRMPPMTAGIPNIPMA